MGAVELFVLQYDCQKRIVCGNDMLAGASQSGCCLYGNNERGDFDGTSGDNKSVHHHAD